MTRSSFAVTERVAPRAKGSSMLHATAFAIVMVFVIFS